MGKPNKKTAPKSQTKSKKTIVLKNPQGTAIGDSNNIVNNFYHNVVQKINEKLLKHLGIGQKVGFSLIGLLVVIVSVGLYFGLRPKQKEIMTGEFRIAIASFAENGSNLPESIGYTVADGLNLRLVSDFQEISVGPKAEIWGPDKVGTINGDTTEDRAKNAEKLAAQIHAHMIIYGVVEETKDGSVVIPEFYLDTQGFHESSEVTGQYGLGSSFSLPGKDNPAWSYNFDRQMQTRSDVISSLAIGMTYYAVHEYDKSLEVLQNIAKDDEWKDEQGKETLYALIGFAAGKTEQYDLAESSLKESIKINPDYARPYIGLASVNYMRALKPFKKSNNPKDIDATLLDNCFKYLELAVSAPEKPSLAEVDTKIHFARGQCYWLNTYTGKLPTFELAVGEFQQVINAYDNGKNPRVQELAGESYARLGFIYRIEKDTPLAIESYKKAADILKGISERSDLYQKSADELSLVTPTP